MEFRKLIAFGAALSISFSLVSCETGNTTPDDESSSSIAISSEANTSISEENITEMSEEDITESDSVETIIETTEKEMSERELAGIRSIVPDGDYYFIMENGPLSIDQSIVWLTLKRINATEFRGVYCTYEFEIGILDQKTNDRYKSYVGGYAYFKDDEHLALIQTPSNEAYWNDTEIRVDSNGEMTFIGDYNTSKLVKNKNDIQSHESNSSSNNSQSDEIKKKFVEYLNELGSLTLSKTSSSRGFVMTFSDVTENGLTLSWDSYGKESSIYCIPTNYTINGTNYGSTYCTYKMVDIDSGCGQVLVLDNAFYFDTDTGYTCYLYITDKWTGKSELNIGADPKLASEGDLRFGHGPYTFDFNRPDYLFLSKENAYNIADNKDNWYLWVDYDSNANANYYSLDPRTNSIHIDIANSGPDPWSVQAKYEWFTLEQGASYHVSFDYQIVLPADKQSAIKESTFSFQHNGSPYDTYYEEPIYMTTNSGEYNHVDSTFEMTSPTDTNSFMGFSVGALGRGVTAEVNIENLIIEKIS